LRGKRTAGSAPARGTGGSACGPPAGVAEAVFVRCGVADVVVGFLGAGVVVGAAAEWVVEEGPAAVVEAEAAGEEAALGLVEAPATSGEPPHEASSTPADTEATTTAALLAREVMGPHRAVDPR
jgi:hypothetical protein